MSKLMYGSNFRVRVSPFCSRTFDFSGGFP